ncbi:hypothetical protein ScPMuIL_017355 [Solemya velum]
MANPRKFSEKIALHNQKQAEETAAFEAILRDVSVATRGAYQNQHLHIQQNPSPLYGSLPNVNQLATNSSIDLQTALQHLENMQSGRNMHPRDRARHAGTHRRTFVTDKSRTDCSPYSSIYLTPPADSNWRRTNSDSALHTSTMAPSPENFHSPTTPPPHRRILEMVGENSVTDASVLKSYWDPKKQLAQQSRPKSCEVPNINIYPSTEQDSGVHIPISNTGSLPDLTVLHFPSPLTKPIDAEDQNYGGGQQASPVNLSPTSAHHMGGMVPNQHQSQQGQSPSQRRRHQGSPSPLVLTSNSSQQQMRIPHSPPVSNIDPSKLTMDPRIRQQYMLYIQQQQRHRGTQSQTLTRLPHPSIVRHQQQIPQVCITSVCNGNGPQASMTQYRNSVPEPGCQSPTSPLSQTSYSPAQSPGLPPASWNNSPFGESYTLQQTNALQHQFEQFNMLQENQTSTDSNLTNSVSSAIYSSPQSSPTFSQAVQGVSSQEYQQQFYPPPLDINRSHCMNSISQQQQRQQQHQQQQNQQVSPQTPKNNIPDIVFTGADDALIRQDFAKELGNAITGFDTDLFPSDEVLKAGLDPLDLDGLQMLTDPTMVADPATEDSFRLDRL